MIQEQPRIMSNFNPQPIDIKICDDIAYNCIDNTELARCFDNNSKIPFTKISGITWTLVHASKPEHYVWCKDCIEKGKIIRYQLVEIFKIQKPHSFFEWKKQTLRMFWAVFDEDTWTKHEHNMMMVKQSKIQNKKEVDA
jgi:hypothetical protein